MVLSMVIIDAHWLDVISIEDGKGQVRSFIQKFLPRSSFAINSQKRENYKFSVISMVIVEGRIFSCMDVTSQVSQKTPVFFHLSCLKFVHSSSITIQDLVTKNQRSQLPEWLCLMSSNALQYTRLNLLSVEMIWAPGKTIILVPIISCKLGEISAELLCFTFLYRFPRQL
jgi:hypothetical protein